jgi:NTP pyrophosphatase (non-canonical NTP hydrolase)
MRHSPVDKRAKRNSPVQSVSDYGMHKDANTKRHAGMVRRTPQDYRRDVQSGLAAGPATAQGDVEGVEQVAAKTIEGNGKSVQEKGETQMSSFDELRDANFLRQREWDPHNQITLEFRGLELGGETGEAQNILKKLARERMGIKGSRATVFDLEQELADIIICVGLIANEFGIDLDKAWRRKFNEVSARHNLETYVVVDNDV